MKAITNIVLKIVLVSVIGGSALSYVYTLTEPQITANKEAKLQKSIRQVLPGATVINNGQIGSEIVYYGINSDGNPIGFACIVSTRGFSSDIKIMVGFDFNSPEPKIIGYRVVDMKETPGLGTQIAKEKFSGQFINMPISNIESGTKLITGATISSKAVRRGLVEKAKLLSGFYDRN